MIWLNKFKDVEYRYVCPKCLRTFLSEEYHEDLFCWRDGEGLVVIPKKDKEDESKLSI